MSLSLLTESALKYPGVQCPPHCTVVGRNLLVLFSSSWPFLPYSFLPPLRRGENRPQVSAIRVWKSHCPGPGSTSSSPRWLDGDHNLPLYHQPSSDKEVWPGGFTTWRILVSWTLNWRLALKTKIDLNHMNLRLPPPFSFLYKISFSIVICLGTHSSNAWIMFH